MVLRRARECAARLAFLGLPARLPVAATLLERGRSPEAPLGWLGRRPERRYGAPMTATCLGDVEPFNELRRRSGSLFALLVRRCELCICNQALLKKKTILYSGSLGSGVDEERSKLRVGM